MNKTYIFKLSLFVLIGVTSAAMDTVSHHYAGSVFESFGYDQFFDPSISWLNKYKDCDPSKGEAFLFASTWLSWTTDFWHMAKFAMLNCLTIAALPKMSKWWHYVVAFVSLRVAFQIGFTLCYDYLFT